MLLYWRFGRRGVVAAQTAVLSVVLLGFASLAIDVGRLYSVRAELQRAADAAALAGASGLASNGMLTHSDAGVSSESLGRAVGIAMENKVFNSHSHLAERDVEFGTIADSADLHSPFVPANPSDANAVRVTLRRAPGNTDGPIPLAFAAVFGRRNATVVATATALLNDRFAGFQPPIDGSGLLIPFTVNQDRYNNQVASGNDDYSYDNGAVKHVGDGVREIWLYPDKQGGGNNGGSGGNGKGKNAAASSTSSDASNGGDGAGNFGILNVGNPNNGAPNIEAQITNGISQENLVAEIGSPEVRFVDEAGGAVTYQIGGDPGIKAGIKDALRSRIGDVVGFFIHTTVTGTGANCEYTIVSMRFGRVMEVDLSGSANGGKGLILQPVAYEGSGVITAPGATSSDAAVSRIQLVR